MTYKNRSAGPSTVPREPRTSGQNNYMDYSDVKQRGIDPCFSPLSDIGHAHGGKKAVAQGKVSYRKVD